jgi:hypothetical protein
MTKKKRKIRPMPQTLKEKEKALREMTPIERDKLVRMPYVSIQHRREE